MFRCLLITFLFVCAPVRSQAPQSDDKARPQAEQTARSPQVHADGRVTFRLRAPNAKQVILVREGAQQGAPMSKDEQGMWRVTTDPLTPDFYAYKFFVDGVVHADPQNPRAKTMVSGGAESVVHVPGPESLIWELNDVPHGNLHRHLYQSELFKEARELWVYTPPGYDPAGTQQYPVLYLLHGVMDDARGWTTTGRAPVILDNLIARGEAKPMLAVFPLGYGMPDAPRRAPELLSGFADQRKIMDAFASSLLDEVVPLVEKSYRASKGRESRAIAGLSMGGAQALYIGLNHLDRFAWIGSFSGAFVMYSLPFDEWFAGLGAQSNPRIRLLWAACGSQDFLIGINQRLKDWLESKEVQATWNETPGAHTWQVWRRYLRDFAPLLFRSKADQEGE